jgi:predicted DNA-binding protein
MADKQTATRLPDDILDRIADLVVLMTTPGHKATQAQVIREALCAGLPLVEEAYRAKAPVDMSDPMKKRKGGGK